MLQTPDFNCLLKKKALCLSWHLKWLKFRQMLSQPFKPYREVQMNSPGTISNMSIIHYRAGWKSDWLSFSSVVLLLFRGGVCFVRQLLPQCQRKKMNLQRPDGDSISEKPRIWQRHLSYDRKYLARMFVTVIKRENSSRLHSILKTPVELYSDHHRENKIFFKINLLK